MKRPRVIPVLLLHNGGLVKSVGFKNYKYIGDPINAVRIFNDLGVDELILLDIDASKEGRTIPTDLVREIGEEANMPFSVGGGIISLSSIREIIRAGAERVILNSSVLRNPEIIREASDAFGSSTIVVCIDYKRSFFGTQKLFSHAGLKCPPLGPVEAAKLAESYGAGEVILQSVDKDGQMSGFDTETIEIVNRSIAIPLVALGGAREIKDFTELFNRTGINGIAAGSFFVYQGSSKGVLIGYPKIHAYNFEAAQ